MDRAIIVHLAVRRAEHRIGRAPAPDMSFAEIAAVTPEPDARVRTRLDALVGEMRVMKTQERSDRWMLAARRRRR